MVAFYLVLSYKVALECKLIYVMAFYEKAKNVLFGQKGHFVVISLLLLCCLCLLKIVCLDET